MKKKYVFKQEREIRYLTENIFLTSTQEKCGRMERSLIN